MAYQVSAKRGLMVRRRTLNGARVTRFVGGGQQRVRASALRREWEFQALMDGGELADLTRQFEQAQGVAQTFAMEDPESGVVHGKCRFGEGALEVEESERGDFRVRFRIVEER